MTEETKSKKPIFVRFLIFLLEAALVTASVLVTLPILNDLARADVSKLPQPTDKAPDLQIVDQFDEFYESIILDAEAAALSVKKHFWLNDDVQLVPKPNPDCYGYAKDPATLQWLIDEAKDKLDFEDTLFSTDIQLAPGSQVDYYLDDSIMVITWQQIFDDYVYTISEVKVSDPSQFRRHITPGKSLNTTTWIAKSINAVVASSGDFYKCRAYGVIVNEGQLLRCHSSYYLDTCYVDRNGDLHFTYQGQVRTEEDVKAFIEEHDIDWSVCFGPVLVDNGERCEPEYYMLGEVNQRYPRAAFGQRGKLHYVLVTANGAGQYRANPTIHTFAKNVATFGCEKVYALDGGQTGSIAMNGKLMNPLQAQYSKGQRVLGDVIYFATAIPERNTETTGS